MNSKKNSCCGNYMRKYGILIGKDKVPKRKRYNDWCKLIQTKHSNKKLLHLVRINVHQSIISINKLATISFYLCFLLDFCHFHYKCNDHGTCKNDGSCQCDAGFFGNDCSGKLIKTIYISGLYLMLVLCQVSWVFYNYNWKRLDKSFKKNIILLNFPCTKYIQIIQGHLKVWVCGGIFFNKSTPLGFFGLSGFLSILQL